MPHSKSLRAVGESLRSLEVTSFVLEKSGQGYTVRTHQPIDPAQLLKLYSAEETLEAPNPSSRHAKLFREDGMLHYDASYVSWLGALGTRQRRNRFTAQASSTANLAQLLRTLGRHLDRVEPHDFRIVWNDGAAVSLDYQRPDGSWVQEMLTTARLRELSLQNRLRRAPRK